MSKHSSPLDLLDDGFESQLICSLYLKRCHQDKELQKMETAVNYSNFLITGNFLRADYKPPTMTEAKVAAKLHGCLDIIQTSNTISSEEQSLLGYDKDGEAVCETTKQQKASLICAENYVNDESDCSFNSDYSEGDEETIASFWRKYRKDKLTTPDIDQSLPLHRPQIITPEMQSSPKLPPKFSLQDILSPQTGNLKYILPKPTLPNSILSTPQI